MPGSLEFADGMFAVSKSTSFYLSLLCVWIENLGRDLQREKKRKEKVLNLSSWIHRLFPFLKCNIRILFGK